METFFNWIPQEMGHFSAMNVKFTLTQLLADGTTLHTEFLFRALDKPKDIKKLLSLEVTGGWINECREVPKQVVDMLIGRLGRYPDTRDGGPTWHGLIMDTNPPDSDHWFYKLFEEDCPGNHVLFNQPSGVSAKAENIKNLPPSYYSNIIAGKDKEWVKVYVHGEYGFVSDGKPVFNEYKERIHSSDEEYTPNTKLTLYIGIDFGLTPAAVFGQLTPSGKMVIFDELCTFDMGAMSFGRLLREKISARYPDMKHIEIYADPAGEQRVQTDEKTPFQILHNQGVMAIPTYTNDFTIRRECVADYLQRLDFSGEPAFLITNGAPTVRKAFSGGYKYKRVQVTGEDKFMDKPEKNKYSHCADATQYLFLGAVGGGRVIGGFDSKPIDYSLANRGIV
jgi:hypothetical protein